MHCAREHSGAAAQRCATALLPRFFSFFFFFFFLGPRGGLGIPRNYGKTFEILLRCAVNFGLVSYL